MKVYKIVDHGKLRAFLKRKYGCMTVPSLLLGKDSKYLSGFLTMRRPFLRSGVVAAFKKNISPSFDGFLKEVLVEEWEEILACGKGKYSFAHCPPYCTEVGEAQAPCKEEANDCFKNSVQDSIPKEGENSAEIVLRGPIGQQLFDMLIFAAQPQFEDELNVEICGQIRDAAEWLYWKQRLKKEG